MGMTVDVYNFWGVKLNQRRIVDVLYIDEPYRLEEAAKEAGLKIVKTGKYEFNDPDMYVALADGVEEVYCDGEIDEPKKPTDDEWQRIFDFVGNLYGQDNYRIDPKLYLGAYVG